jgi:prophage regulatory protein
MRLLLYEDLEPKGIKLTKVSIWRLVKKGKFPRPVKLGQKNAWPEPEIDAFFEQLIAERDAVAEAAEAGSSQPASKSRGRIEDELDADSCLPGSTAPSLSTARRDHLDCRQN